jgi:hypothetical protein
MATGAINNNSTLADGEREEAQEWTQNRNLRRVGIVPRTTYAKHTEYWSDTDTYYGHEGYNSHDYKDEHKYKDHRSHGGWKPGVKSGKRSKARCNSKFLYGCKPHHHRGKSE